MTISLRFYITIDGINLIPPLYFFPQTFLNNGLFGNMKNIASWLRFKAARYAQI